MTNEQNDTPSQDQPSRVILSQEEVDMLAALMRESSPQLTFDQASRITGLQPEMLRHLVRSGVIEGVAPWRTKEQILGTCDLEQARNVAHNLESARRSIGGGILVTDAAEKYGFNRETIYGWLRDGWVHKYGNAPNGDLLVNESDMAFARKLADLVKQKQGKPVFPKRRYNV